VKEGILRAAPGPRAAAEVQLDRLLEDVQLVTAVGSRHCSTCGAEVEALAVRGLVDHVRELELGEHVAEIDERPRHGRHRDAAIDGYVERVEAEALVDHDARDRLVAAGHEYMRDRGREP
jgi:hypothetical protein